MNKKLLYSIFGVLVLIYTATVFIFKADATAAARYHLDDTGVKLLSLTIIIPVFLFWFLAVYGLVHLGTYYKKIKGSAEAEGIKYLMAGLAVFGFGQAVNSILSRVFSYLVNQGVIDQAVSVIITTHLSLIPPLLSFLLIFLGALKLVRTVKKVKMPAWYGSAAGVLLSVVSAMYALATIANPSRTVPVAPAVKATYYMPDPLIITTIILPYIVIWTLGFHAVLMLMAYYRSIGGKIYKKALARFNTGLMLVILSSISLQFLSAANTIISGWGLMATLGLLYILIVFIGVGYAFIANGSKRLSKLEDVT